MADEPNGADDETPDEFPPFWDVPDPLRVVVQNLGFPSLEIEDPEEEAIYARMRAGRCMTCQSPLGENANIIINRHGVVGAYCSGPCHSDMAVLGWIGEQHDDIISAIKFRGDFPADEADDSEGS